MLNIPRFLELGNPLKRSEGVHYSFFLYTEYTNFVFCAQQFSFPQGTNFHGLNSLFWLMFSAFHLTRARCTLIFVIFSHNFYLKIS